MGLGLIDYPVVCYFPMHFVGLLILALYNLVVDGRFVVNL